MRNCLVILSSCNLSCNFVAIQLREKCLVQVHPLSLKVIVTTSICTKKNYLKVTLLQRIVIIVLFAEDSQHFFCIAITEAQRNNIGSVCTALQLFSCFSLHMVSENVIHVCHSITKSYRSYPSHNTLQVPILLGISLRELVSLFVSRILLKNPSKQSNLASVKGLFKKCHL